MSEIFEISARIGQLVSPAAPEARDRQFDSRSGPSFVEIVENEKIKRNQECFAELISESNGPSFASQNCTEGDKTELIECKASTMIPDKSTVAENGENVSEDSSNADVVCGHEQARLDDEDTGL
jgi:hypothetical protein